MAETGSWRQTLVVTVPALIVSLVVTLFSAVAIFSWFFEDREEFLECLGSAFTPDFISLFRGELFEDFGRSCKLSFYFLVASVPGMIAAAAVDELVRYLESVDLAQLPF